MEHEFVGFPKIARLSRDVIVTEKIDGTLAHIRITDDGQFLIGSKSRWITPENDNHGFARWATEHKDELMTLGPGSHFGEWWGSGIQRGYGLRGGDKRLSLFNVSRWCLHGQTPKRIGESTKEQEILPSCVGLVPVLYRGVFDTVICDDVLGIIATGGSVAAPGFLSPEGIVVFHVAANVGFKKTIGNDGAKGAQ